MKCQRCKGEGKLEYPGFADRYFQCPKCNGTGELEMTNEEYIRSCTFEELAGEIYEWYSAGYTTGRVGLPLNSITGIVEWLKEKHEPLKNDEK